jgi:hypothetical protein
MCAFAQILCCDSITDIYILTRPHMLMKLMKLTTRFQGTVIFCVQEHKPVHDQQKYCDKNVAIARQLGQLGRRRVCCSYRYIAIACCSVATIAT